ncbi:hypothetical protein [Cesiribacter andamanensis]|uniref:Uncharacterized protein n=1 Tax=Cesiribacter andamanensis AMV16 TaxID=1279009 RepID=M7NWF4_9BACT|nr:hypothetical protein [Cesiribacter andamanensis]EMR02759.1 hypothetical protein ADICEAN_02087 [Cesiribacter andamanensis AMV16]
MQAILLVIGVSVSAVATFVVYRLLTVRRQNAKLNQQRFDRIKPLYDQLENDGELSHQQIYEYAKSAQTREMTYLLLSEHNKADAFPAEFNTIVKAAESNLVSWLEFPTELNACPDEIEHLKRVTIDFDGQQNYVHYEVFKYKTYEPHWAAKGGWILGVVGPYFDDSKPYDHPSATFSRVSSRLETTTPDEEAKWVHENISMRK